MRKIPIDYLRPGMIVANDIYNVEGNILLGRNVVLEDSYIRQLRYLNIHSIYVEDGLSEGIEVQDLISERTRQDAISNVKDIFSNTRNQVAYGKNIIIENVSLSQTVESIIQELLSNKKVLVNLFDIRVLDNYTFAHSVNVAVLAAITGISLNLSENQLRVLTLGALLHDIGKIFIPEEILQKPGRLTPEEYTIMKTHSELGYNLLRQQKDLNILCSKIALEHHEKIDGSGYPRGLQGDEIHLYSQIIGVVDVYDALTSDRVYHEKIYPYEAYEYLAGTGGSIFDYELIKVFLKQIACYPAGTLVEVSSGEVGIVVSTPITVTTRPVIKVLFKDKQPVREPYELEMVNYHNKVISRVFLEGEFNEYLKKYKQSSTH